MLVQTSGVVHELMFYSGSHYHIACLSEALNPGCCTSLSPL